MTMGERLTIGQQWRPRKERHALYVVRQVHRKDRQVVLLGSEGKLAVQFRDLRARWELVA